jgi:prephenate dehydratase/chorismate mutase/prephenate dehydratase
MTRVAYQGEPGAFGEEAVIGWFGEAVEPKPVATFSAVMHAVESADADAGVLPLENSVAGTVGDALDALANGSLQVVGEVLLPIRHHLLVVPGAGAQDIRTVSSHWQALAQCERYLAGHPWQAVAAADTAGAARELAARGDRSTAAIASRSAATRYGLDVLEADIQDADHNVTRFAILARDGTAPEPAGSLAPRGDDRETLVTFETGHEPGDLHRALGALASDGINLSRIESRPSGEGPWRYRFLIQVAGDAALEPLRGALERMRAHTRSMRVLGSFASGGEDH